MIIITTLSIFVISGMIFLARKIWPSFRVCPICAGVSGTWLWILIGIWTGWLEANSWKLIAALAMGGSVVGVAYQIEKRIKPDKIMAWKIFFIPTGFALAYNLIYFSWLYVLLLSVIIFLTIFFFLKWLVSSKSRTDKDGRIVDIEKKMENCC